MRERGASTGTGKRHVRSNQPLIAASKGFPLTTWADVIVFYDSFMQYTDPTPKQCIQQLRKQGKTAQQAEFLCWSDALGASARGFVHTKDFERDKAYWKSWSPYAKGEELSGRPGNATAGITYAMTKIPTNEIYPFNEEFWGYGNRYAVARSAAGVVPGKLDIAVEATVEAIQELPTTIKNSIAAVVPKIPIPNLSAVADFIKWGSIGGGLFMLYWYVLRPKKR